MTTQIIESTAPVVTNTDEGDHDRFAHYVAKPDLERAILDGIPCRALCGKMWLPTRDAQTYPVCPECKEIWETMKDE
jgi:hypothetical protein